MVRDALPMRDDNYNTESRKYQEQVRYSGKRREKRDGRDGDEREKLRERREERKRDRDEENSQRDSGLVTVPSRERERLDLQASTQTSLGDLRSRIAASQKFNFTQK